jgi:hypothetical protein
MANAAGKSKRGRRALAAAGKPPAAAKGGRGGDGGYFSGFSPLPVGMVPTSGMPSRPVGT